MSRVRKAKSTEKRKYEREMPRAFSNPLYGFVTIDGARCAVRQIGDGHKRPSYEVMAPNRFCFKTTGSHSLSCCSLVDINVRTKLETLVPCPDDCDCRLANPTHENDSHSTRLAADRLVIALADQDEDEIVTEFKQARRTKFSSC